MSAFLDSEEALLEFARAFEAGEVSREIWTHAAHVAVGTVFTRRHGTNVLAPMRAALRRHAAAVGAPPTAYHETLTVLWLAIIDDVLREEDFPNDITAARELVRRFGMQRKLHNEYYSLDVLTSDLARTTWVAPDMRTVTVRFLLSS